MLHIPDLQDKTVLITGASGGIGATVACAFAQQGSQVAIHCHSNASQAANLIQKIRDSGGRATLIQGDLTQPGAALRIVADSVESLGALDILINNAGSLISRQPILDAEDSWIDRVFALNAKSVISTVQAAVPHMAVRGGGTIINVGSIAGLDGGGSGTGVYGASKAFVHNLSRHLARELATRNIRVNTVSPGVVDTAFHASTPPERMEAMRRSVPLSRIGTPTDCVGAFLFLASQQLSGYITGQNIHVNGGQLMP